MNPAAKLVLPEVNPPSRLSASVMRRAVRIMFGIMIALFLLALVTAFSVRTSISVSAIGAIEPTETWRVHAREGGIVTEVRVRNGDSVKAGSALITLDSSKLVREIAALRASIAEREINIRRASLEGSAQARQRSQRSANAQARIVQAKATLRERLTELGISDHVDSVRVRHVQGSHVEIDRILAELTSAEMEAQIASEELGSDLASSIEVEREMHAVGDLNEQLLALVERKRHLAIHAPSGGVVLTRYPERLLGTMLSPGQELIVIANLSDWQAVLRVGEDQIKDVRIGDSVVLMIDAIRRTQKETISGVVSFIPPAPSADDAEAALQRANGIYEVLVTIRSDQIEGVREKLMPGFSVRAEIVSHADVIARLLVHYFKTKMNGSG